MYASERKHSMLQHRVSVTRPGIIESLGYDTGQLNKTSKKPKMKDEQRGKKKKEGGKTQTRKEEEKEKEIRWRIKREKSSVDNIICK